MARDIIMKTGGMKHLFVDPTRVGIELLYAAMVVILCLLIYLKTKEMYNLTKHKGVNYFRNAFLFFGLAYLFRFVFTLIKLTRVTFDVDLPRLFIQPLSLVLVGYLSTIAIFYLTASTIWKHIKGNKYNILLHLIALLIAILVFVTRSPDILLLTQVILLLFTLVMGYLKFRRSKKLSQLSIIYFLLFIFWVINLRLDPRHFFPFEFQAATYIVSVGIFMIIYNKVNKWTK